MGFLRKKTSFCKLFVCSLLAICLYGQNASATISTTGSFTDSNNITWSWAIDETYNEDPKVYIGFKSAPADTTTIVIPSMADVLAKINDSSIANVTTYYVSDLTDYEAAETIPTSVTKLDMTNMTDTNGHAGQIMSIAPLFENNTNEIELVFNNNAIISQRATTFNETGDKGAFEGLKLKLTNFDKIKYIGWRAFRNATLNNANRDITISSSQTLGGHVFEGSNVKTLSLETEEIGEALCKNCSELTSVTFGDGVKTLYGSVFQNTPKLKQAFESKNIEEIGGAAFKNSAITSVSFNGALKRIHAMAFMNTDLGSLDFTDISPKIDTAAFYNAGLNTIDLGSLKALDTLSFGNNNLKDVYLPKTIEFVGAGIFNGNPIETFTVAYDPLALKQYSYPDSYNSHYFLSTFVGGTTSGGIYYDDEYVGFNDRNVTTNLTLRKLNIVAPYDDNDTIPARQKAMESYSLAAKYLGEVRNVIPYGYFQDTGTYLDEINIGEGIDYIAEQAFMASYTTMGYGSSDGTEKNPNGVSPSKLTLPSTLRGIADRAFMWTLNNKNLVLASLPTNLVYIGGKAFAFNPNLNITNFDLPNLKYIGENAFIGASIKNITMRDAIEYVGPRAFVGNWALENLTFDTDIFGKKNNANIMGGRFGELFTSQVGRNFAVPSPIVWNGGYQDSIDPLKYEICPKTITFTEKSITAPPADQGMYRGCAETFDASAAKWTVINYHTFFANRINEVKLPNTVAAINENAFMRAEITKPLTLPTGLKSIGTRAFWGTYISEDGSLSDEALAKIKVPISNLPNTVETIGEYAFYKNSGFTADVNSSSLKRIGTQAFYGSNIRDLTLFNSIEQLGSDIALSTPKLRNVTIDMNLHDATKITGSNDYRIFVNNFGDKQHKLGKVTFTENAGQPFGGFSTYNDVYTPADELRTCYDPTECGKDFAYFYGINAEEVDLSATNWTVIAPSMFQTAKIDTLSLPAGTTLIGDDAFYRAELGEISLPTALQTIDEEAFQWATVTINEFPESLRTINRSAFFGTDITDDLKIHGGIQYIGKDAFNAGDADVYYEKITLDPDLTYAKTANQPIFVVFYGAEVDKMTINSAGLPALHADDGIPEFHGMTMQEVEITALPAISKNAFEDCSRLKKVDASKDTALRLINDEAFINDIVLDEIYFAPALKNETVALGRRPFKKTAFTSIGGAGSDFNLSAAKFDGAAGYAFSGMPKVKSINVISTFSNGTVPEASFFNDAEVETAEIAFEISRIDNGAFANDNKLKSIFIWGDTEVRDNNLPGFTGNTGGSGGDNSDEPNMGPTIPEGTDIYAYSTWSAEPYAGSTARDNFEGEFYPLDEVLYIEANDPNILIDEDSSDFDKSEIVVYALRRDGVVLESTTWGQFSGRTFTRANSPVSFSNVDESTTFGVIHDTPVALNILDYGNENFANIDGQLVADSSRPSGYRIDVNYRDAYTNYPSNDDINPYTEGEGGGHPIPGLPVTRDELIVHLAVFTLSAIGLVAWSVNRLAKRQ